MTLQKIFKLLSFIESHIKLAFCCFSEGLSILTNNLINHGGVIRQYIGPQKPSLVTANRDFLQFLCRHSKYIGKAKFYRYLKPWLGEGLLTSDGSIRRNINFL